MNLEKLQELGFHSAAKKVSDKIALREKLHVAYNNFEFITPEDIKTFKDVLKKKTRREDKSYIYYDTLEFVPVHLYEEVPPQQVLDKMEAAIKLNCFDTFKIAKIESVEEVKDPILFGVIKGCGDKFYIAQWDNDVTIEMIKAASSEKKA